MGGEGWKRGTCQGLGQIWWVNRDPFQGLQWVWQGTLQTTRVVWHIEHQAVHALNIIINFGSLVGSFYVRLLTVKIYFSKLLESEMWDLRRITWTIKVCSLLFLKLCVSIAITYQSFHYAWSLYPHNLYCLEDINDLLHLDTLQHSAQHSKSSAATQSITAEW